MVLEDEGDYAAAIAVYRQALALDLTPACTAASRQRAAMGRTQESESEQRLDEEARANRIRARGVTR